MPREVIARRSEEDFAREGGPALERREEDLNVEWARFSTPEVTQEVVQVTIRQASYAPYYDGDPVLGPNWRPVTGRELYSSALTRKEVNKLIATLRRARDQVFGTDA